MSILELKKVRKTRGNFTLHVDECRIEQGQIYAVVGPNGSGKTTLLNLLAFMESPTEGVILMNGEQVHKSGVLSVTAARQTVACMLQNPYLFTMSVRDNVELGLKLAGIPPHERRSRAETVMTELRLESIADQASSSLSGGEAQRVALARTLAMDRSILLLDEPTAAIDRQHVKSVEAAIARRASENGTTVLVSTHSRDQAYRISKNILSIIDGRLSDVAYENVFSGTLTDHDGDLSMSVTAEADIRVGHGTAGPASIAIDPGDIILSENEIDSSALNRFHGTIVRVEAADSSLRVFVDCDFEICAEITRQSFERMKLNAGSTVCVTFKANAVEVI